MTCMYDEKNMTMPDLFGNDLPIVEFDDFCPVDKGKKDIKYCINRECNIAECRFCILADEPVP